MPKHWPSRLLCPGHNSDRKIASSAPMTFVSLRDTYSVHAFLHVPDPLRLQPKLHSVRVWFAPESSLGVAKDALPSTLNPCVHSRSTPSEEEVFPRPETATPRTCSTFVVPPDLGGLLRIDPCRFVAPCSRSWVRSVWGLFPPKIRRSSPFPLLPRERSTLRSLPLADSRSASPRPLPPRHSTAVRSTVPTCCHAVAACFPAVADLEALLYRRVRCTVLALPPARCPILPWAFIPR